MISATPFLPELLTLTRTPRSMLTSFMAAACGFANTDELPGYYPLNLGFTHIFHLPERYGSLKFRFDVTNIFDQGY